MSTYYCSPKVEIDAYYDLLRANGDDSTVVSPSVRVSISSLKLPHCLSVLLHGISYLLHPLISHVTAQSKSPSLSLPLCLSLSLSLSFFFFSPPSLSHSLLSLPLFFTLFISSYSLFFEFLHCSLLGKFELVLCILTNWMTIWLMTISKLLKQMHQIYWRSHSCIHFY